MGMLVGIVAGVLLLVCLLFVGGGCSSKTPPGPPPVVSVAGMESLDRAAVRALLKRLADTSAPKETVLGAMCYAPEASRSRADYLCPKCGERTVYDDGAPKSEDQPKRWLARAVALEIPHCRREFLELRKVTGDAIAFDESQFCRKCSPKVTAPKLVLHISYKGGKTRDIEKIEHGDLRILAEFLSGKLLTKSDNGGTSPLKECLPRLQELLGVKIDE